MTDSVSGDDSGKVYIICPCYNEEEGLEKLLHRIYQVAKLKKWAYRLVIVNDGSQDHTRDVILSFVDDMPIDFIDFQENQGISKVFNTAFSHVLQHSVSDQDLVVTIDSDNTMNPYLLLDLVARIRDVDVVIASRFIPGGRMVGAGYRALLSYAASWLMRYRVGLPNVTDYSIFLRAYRVTVVREYFRTYGENPMVGRGFSSMAGMLMQLYKMNPAIRMAEVPLVLRYDEKKSKSSIRIFQTILGYLKLAFAVR